ncbi:ESX-1 secretion-associated protein, partial [Mycobacterium simiae]
MADLVVTPENLARMATLQEQASAQAQTAAGAASNVEAGVWVTHGVASAFSNIAFTKAVAARASTGFAMKNSSAELAAKLRTAQ